MPKKTEASGNLIQFQTNSNIFHPVSAVCVCMVHSVHGPVFSVLDGLSHLISSMSIFRMDGVILGPLCVAEPSSLYSAILCSLT